MHTLLAELPSLSRAENTLLPLPTFSAGESEGGSASRVMSALRIKNTSENNPHSYEELYPKNELFLNKS